MRVRGTKDEKTKRWCLMDWVHNVEGGRRWGVESWLGAEDLTDSDLRYGIVQKA